jgi:hypothetical protein
MFGELFARFWLNRIHVVVTRAKSVLSEKVRFKESSLESQQNGLEWVPARTGVPRHHSSNRN